MPPTLHPMIRGIINYIMFHVGNLCSLHCITLLGLTDLGASAVPPHCRCQGKALVVPGGCMQPLVQSYVENLSSHEQNRATVQCCDCHSLGWLSSLVLVVCLKWNTKYTKLWRCEDACWCWWWQLKSFKMAKGDQKVNKQVQCLQLKEATWGSHISTPMILAKIGTCCTFLLSCT